MRISYLSNDGDLKPWPDDGVPVDVNTDRARTLTAVEELVGAVEKSTTDQAEKPGEAKS
jgi:hypothetical protein